MINIVLVTLHVDRINIKKMGKSFNYRINNVTQYIVYLNKRSCINGPDVSPDMKDSCSF